MDLCSLVKHQLNLDDIRWSCLYLHLFFFFLFIYLFIFSLACFLDLALNITARFFHIYIQLMFPFLLPFYAACNDSGSQYPKLEHPGTPHRCHPMQFLLILLLCSIEESIFFAIGYLMKLLCDLSQIISLMQVSGSYNDYNCANQTI